MSENSQPRSLSVHIPLTLLSLAIAIFLASQIGAASRTTETIQWQLGNIDKSLTEIREAHKQLTELIGKREELVKQSSAVQEQYTKLLTDVLDLAKTDKDAQEVIEKWKVQRNEPPADASKPAEAAKPEQK